jgi:mycothiol synthase
MRASSTSPPVSAWWRGEEIPDHALVTAESFGSMRGDEVFTEEVAIALGRRDDRCTVLMIAENATSVRGVAAVLDGAPARATECIVETSAPHDRPDIHHLLLKAVARQRNTSAAIRWRPPTTSPLVRFSTPDGSVLERTIIEMRAMLPLNVTGSHRGPHPGVAYRGYDECDGDAIAQAQFIESVIRINNNAFADHPEQGAMSASTFNLKTKAAWFDAHHLVVASIEGNDVGFVWMKCEHPRPAELYVICVDPTATLSGLGRLLVRHGFDHAVDGHRANEAMLFVDAANHRAIGLYESLGFRSTRRQDIVRIQPSGA